MHQPVALHHSRLDHHLGIRAYDREELDILKSHVDYVNADGRGKMLRYASSDGQG